MERAGEIIEATTIGFTAESYELFTVPPLGSLVKTGKEPVYGVICQAGTSSIEPGRRPLARGRNEADEEAVYQSNPQLAHLLRSEFSVLAVGYELEREIQHCLPPQPAAIHGFVYLCSPEEVRRFGCSFNFFSTLLSSQSPVATEGLIAACLRNFSLAYDEPHAFLVTAGKHLATLLRGNYNQLRAILEGVSHE